MDTATAEKDGAPDGEEEEEETTTTSGAQVQAVQEGKAVVTFPSSAEVFYNPGKEGLIVRRQQQQQ